MKSGTRVLHYLDKYSQASEGDAPPLISLVELSRLELILEHHSRTSNMAFDLIDHFTGMVLVKAGRVACCESYHRDNPGSALECKLYLPEGPPNERVRILKGDCPIDLSMGHASITVRGKPIADLFAGPVQVVERTEGIVSSGSIYGAPESIDGVKAIYHEEFIDFLIYISELIANMARQSKALNETQFIARKAV